MKTLVIILIISFFEYGAIAQISKSSITKPKGIYTIKGDYYFDHENYTAAISNYNKAMNQKPGDVYLLLRIAEAYDKSGIYDLATQWYNKAFTLDPALNERYLLQFISVLTKTGQSSMLKYWTKAYNDRLSQDKNGLREDTTLYFLANLKLVNSDRADVSPVFYKDNLIFSSNRNTDKYQLYKSTLIDGEYKTPSIYLNSVLNAGALAIVQDQAKLFFTQLEYPTDANKMTMKIFSSDLKVPLTDEITAVDAVAIKNFKNGEGHPAVSRNGTTMIFTSNNQKNKSGFDLYRSEFKKGKWSTPNALNYINTNADEMYPTLLNDSILYFASNRSGGFGGFDIYKVNLVEKKPKVQHLVGPINSSYDDFNLFFYHYDEYCEGYLTSNRPGGLGDNDIYKLSSVSIKKNKDITPHISTEPILAEELLIYTSSGDEIRLSDHKKRNIKFELNPSVAYTLVMSYDNFKTGVIKPDSKTNLSRGSVYNFSIEKYIENVFNLNDFGQHLKDIHINPGDLVTFQLIPNTANSGTSRNSRITFDGVQTAIATTDTLVFSYVAELSQKPSDTYDILPVAAAESTNTNKLPLEGRTSVANTTEKNFTVKTNSTEVQVQDKAFVESNKSFDLLNKHDTTTVAFVKTDLVSGSIKDRQANASIANQVNPLSSMSTVTSTQGPVPSKQIQLADDKTLNQSNAIADQSSGLSTNNNVSADNNTTDNKNLLLPTPAVTESQQQLSARAAQLADDKASANSLVKSDEIPSSPNSLINNSESGDSTQLRPTPSPIDPQNTQSISQFQSTNKKNIDTTVALDQPSDLLTINSTGVSDHKTISIREPNLSIERQNKSLGNIRSGSTITKTEQAQESKHTDNTVATIEDTDFVYRVQIAASHVMLGDAKIKKIYSGSRTIRFFEEEGYYKYFIEETPDFMEARRVLKESNVNDAFIASYKDGTKWNLHEAITLQKKEHSGKNPLDAQPNEIKSTGGTQSTTPDSLITSLANAVQGEHIEDTVSTNSSINLPNVAVIPAVEPTPNLQVVETSVASDSITRTGLSNQEMPTTREVTNKEEVIHYDSSSNNNLVQHVSQQAPVEVLATTNSSEIASDQDLLNTTGDSFLYRVQIAASSKKMSDKQLKQVYTGTHKIQSFEEQGFKKYYIAETPNYFIAKHVLKESGVDQAFIAAYKSNKKWVLQDALRHQYKEADVLAELAPSDSIIKIVTVHFEYDEFKLPSDEEAHVLENIVNQLRLRQECYAIVNGFTDVRGTEEYNFGLSQERATYVKQFIISNGVNPTRVTTRYFGESQLLKYCPKEENCDESVHQANRRAEVLLLIKKTP